MSSKIDEDTERAILKSDLAQSALVVQADELFKRDDTVLLPNGVPTLHRMGSFIKRFKALKVRIEVHTDSDTQGATKLSRSQSKSIRDWLVKEVGIASNIFVSVGYGDQKPIADNGTTAGQKANRRVEIVIED